MKIIFTFTISAFLALTVCAGDPATLKAGFKGDFLIGAALNPSQFCESNLVEAGIVKAQFNAISPENVLKWEHIHPQPGQYDFSLADKYVDFGQRNQMFVVGHTLVWHAQTPDWVFQDRRGRELSGTNADDRALLLRRMHDHIFTVVGRYKGKINGWDVVNEAVADDGKLRDSPWLRVLGSYYIRQAFEFAHAADPQAQLYYNDYGLENPGKLTRAIQLVSRLRSERVKIFAVGLQGHYGLETPSTNEIDHAIAAFASLGVKVMISELDVDVLPSAWAQNNADISRNFALEKRLNPYPDGLPPDMQNKLADRYANLFKVFLAHDRVITRVTFWGVEDGDSWLNNWPVYGRTDYPLLFDRQCWPKPAFYSVIATAPGPEKSEETDAALNKMSKSTSAADQDSAAQ